MCAHMCMHFVLLKDGTQSLGPAGQAITIENHLSLWKGNLAAVMHSEVHKADSTGASHKEAVPEAEGRRMVECKEGSPRREGTFRQEVHVCYHVMLLRGDS